MVKAYAVLRGVSFLAYLSLSGCSGIAPSPTSAAPAAPSPVAVTRIALVAAPGELPIGGGTARLRIETTGAGLVAPGVLVSLHASTGVLEHAQVTTDHTGHATVEWTGTQTAAFTATAGEIAGAIDLVVRVPPEPRPPSPPRAPVPEPEPPLPLPSPTPSPTPTPTPAPTPAALVVTMTAPKPAVPIGESQIYTASVTGLNGESVVSFEWAFDGTVTGSTATTVGPTRAWTYTTHGVRTPTVKVTTTGNRSASGTMRVVVPSPALR